MKKIIGILLISTFLLSACSTDGNNEKAANIINTRGQIPETKNIIPRQSIDIPKNETASPEILNTTEKLLNKAGLKFSYTPGELNIYIINISDLPKEDAFGPITILGQDSLLYEKNFLQKSNSGTICTTQEPDDSTKGPQSFCQIQTHGDSKGRFQIEKTPQDGSGIEVSYMFYTGDFKITLAPSNTLCGQEPCGFLNRWEDTPVDKPIPIEKIISSYLRNTSLKYIINKKKGDFKDIFITFKKTIDSIKFEK